MVFYILTVVVFIAELIIALAIIIYLLKMSKLFRDYNILIDEIKPKIADLLKIGTKISEQLVELAPMFVEKIKSIFSNLVIGQLKNVLATITFWLVKTEVEKHANK